MESAFSDCDSLIDVSDAIIPNSVTVMNFTFSSCDSLTKAPKLSTRAVCLSHTFSGCHSLITAPEISSWATEIDGMFNDCTSLTGTVIINANIMLTDRYAKCFKNVNFTTQNLVLAGSSSKLDNYGSTGLGYCSRCNGTCQGNH